MRILMALSQLEVTGAEVYAVNIGEELVKKNHEVFYVSDTLTLKTSGKYFKLRFNKRRIFNRIWHIIYLFYLIKKYKIQVVHSHSRASAWSSHWVCKFAKIPMITTVHGRQAVHKSSKFFFPKGNKVLCVCENIKHNLVKELNVSEKYIEILRNGINIEEYKSGGKKVLNNEKKIVSIIGRLSGPKGDIAYKLMEKSFDYDKYEVRMIGGKDIPERFNKFKEKVKFMGYIKNVSEEMAKSDLIIGAGRVAMEALLMNKPIIAIGEAKGIGLVTIENINEAMESNFGDIGLKLKEKFDWKQIKKDINAGLSLELSNEKLREMIVKNYNLYKIVERIEKIYLDAFVEVTKYELPILMYHKVLESKEDAGVHGTYVTKLQMEHHLKVIKKMDYETITFEELNSIGLNHRFDKKYIILTFDDGYKDNYSVLLPLLEKYNMKAVIYLVSKSSFNKWDAENMINPEKKYEILNQNEIVLLLKSGRIEFGGHTTEHIDLLKVEDKKLEEILVEDLKEFKEKTGKTPLTFAYPYGSVNLKAKEILKNIGYRYALACDTGSLNMTEDLFHIRRVLIFNTISKSGIYRKISGTYNYRKIKRENKKNEYNRV